MARVSDYGYEQFNNPLGYLLTVCFLATWVYHSTPSVQVFHDISSILGLIQHAILTLPSVSLF
jgi:hypothetical protein